MDKQRYYQNKFGFALLESSLIAIVISTIFLLLTLAVDRLYLYDYGSKLLQYNLIKLGQDKTNQDLSVLSKDVFNQIIQALAKEQYNQKQYNLQIITASFLGEQLLIGEQSSAGSLNSSESKSCKEHLIQYLEKITPEHTTGYQNKYLIKTNFSRPQGRYYISACLAMAPFANSMIRLWPDTNIEVIKVYPILFNRKA